MIPRDAKDLVLARLTQLPAVAVLGPRQVGKTTLALSIAEGRKPPPVYLDLEQPEDRAKLAEPALFLRGYADRLVILDEVQRAPGLFEVLRGLIDERRRKGERHGHFLLLGSASLDLLRQSAESLAGRIAYVELTGILVTELPSSGPGAEVLWRRGGFPDSLLAKDEAESLAWRKDFIRTYLERDVPALGPRIPAETLRRFWTMLAHSQGSLLNAARLAAALAVSGHTIARYLDLMTDLLLVRALRPWSGNIGKRLVKSPKTYVRDSGIVHALLDIGSMEQLLGHPVVGASWEGFAIEQLIAAAPSEWTAWFYRSAGGAEIDLVFESQRGRYAVEVKRSLSPTPSKGFAQACNDISAIKRYIVYPGNTRYPHDAATEVAPLESLMDELRRIAGG
jgi:predicted AAA+ superfamily ATPase